MFHKLKYSPRSPSPRCPQAVFFVSAAFALLFTAEPTLAQTPHRQTRLEVLRQQNALIQQQTAVQTAVQQTTVLVQSANQSVRLQTGAPPTVSFQAQANALQIASQQTTFLLQTTRPTSPLAQWALQQQNILQTALQQTIAVQATTSSGTQLTPSQLQLLAQEQNSLTQLLTTQQRPVQRTGK
jgi:hypothetical protein